MHEQIFRTVSLKSKINFKCNRVIIITDIMRNSLLKQSESVGTYPDVSHYPPSHALSLVKLKKVPREQV